MSHRSNPLLMRYLGEMSQSLSAVSDLLIQEATVDAVQAETNRLVRATTHFVRTLHGSPPPEDVIMNRRKWDKI